MIKKVYAIRDNEATYYLSNVYLVDNEVFIVRDLKTLVNNGGTSPLVKYPEQFTLCQLGTFDDEKGTFTNEFRVVCTLSDLVIKHNE